MNSKELAKKYRIMLLKKIVNSILAGSFNHKEVDPNKLFQMHNTERQSYQSPVERSGYNYGYQTIGELGAGQDTF
jgi:hypothetical protein